MSIPNLIINLIIYMMKLVKLFLSIVIILVISSSCEELQKNVEDKANEIQETAERKIEEQLERVDSTIVNLDSTMHNQIDLHVKKVDTLITDLNKDIN